MRKCIHPWLLKSPLNIDLKAPEHMEYIWVRHKNHTDNDSWNYRLNDLYDIECADKKVINGHWIVVFPTMLGKDQWAALQELGVKHEFGRINYNGLNLYLRDLSVFDEGETKNFVVNSLIWGLLLDRDESGTEPDMWFDADLNDPCLIKLLSMSYKPATQEDLLSDISTDAKFKELGFTV